MQMNVWINFWNKVYNFLWYYKLSSCKGIVCIKEAISFIYFAILFRVEKEIPSFLQPLYNDVLQLP